MSGGELSWGDSVPNPEGSSSSGKTPNLPDGVYPFTIRRYEKGRFDGSDKLPPCPKAVIYLEVDGGQYGKVNIRDNLFLHENIQGLLGAFFRGIGLRQRHDNMVLDFDCVVGRKGWAQIHRNGEYLNVKKYLPPEKWPADSAIVQPVQQPPSSVDLPF